MTARCASSASVRALDVSTPWWEWEAGRRGEAWGACRRPAPWRALSSCKGSCTCSRRGAGQASAHRAPCRTTPMNKAPAPRVPGAPHQDLSHRHGGGRHRAARRLEPARANLRRDGGWGASTCAGLEGSPRRPGRWRVCLHLTTAECAWPHSSLSADGNAVSRASPAGGSRPGAASAAAGAASSAQSVSAAGPGRGRGPQRQRRWSCGQPARGRGPAARGARWRRSQRGHAGTNAALGAGAGGGRGHAFEHCDDSHANGSWQKRDANERRFNRPTLG